MSGGFLDLETVRFRLLITGLPPIETNLEDTIKLAKNAYVMGFCFLLGLIVGVFYAAAFHVNGAGWVFPLIIFPLAPVTVNFLANFIAFTYLRLRAFSRIGSTSEVLPAVRSALTVFSAIVPIWVCYLEFQSWMYPEKPTGLVFYLAIPLLYVIVSEAIHFVIFRYISQDIVQEMSPGKKLHSVLSVALEEPVEEPEHQPEMATSRQLEIGRQTFTDSDIVMLEAQGNYLRVVTSSGEFIERCLMSTATQNLDEGLGLQIHRSYWVSFAAILSLVRLDNSLCIQLTNGEEVKIARPRQRHVRDALAARGMVPHIPD